MCSDHGHPTGCHWCFQLPGQAMLKLGCALVVLHHPLRLKVPQPHMLHMFQTSGPCLTLMTGTETNTPPGVPISGCLHHQLLLLFCVLGAELTQVLKAHMPAAPGCTDSGARQSLSERGSKLSLLLASWYATNQRGSIDEHSVVNDRAAGPSGAPSSPPKLYLKNVPALYLASLPRNCSVVRSGRPYLVGQKRYSVSFHCSQPPSRRLGGGWSHHPSRHHRGKIRGDHRTCKDVSHLLQP